MIQEDSGEFRRIKENKEEVRKTLWQRKEFKRTLGFIIPFWKIFWGFLCEKFWSNLMFSNAQLCHRLSWGHQRSAIEFWKTIWSLLICSVLIERIEITYQRGIPDTSFTCLHLTGITSTARKTNGIPIWHSVKKNDVKIATIGWQLDCRQIQSKFFWFWNYETWDTIQSFDLNQKCSQIRAFKWI